MNSCASPVALKPTTVGLPLRDVRLVNAHHFAWATKTCLRVHLCNKVQDPATKAVVEVANRGLRQTSQDTDNAHPLLFDEETPAIRLACQALWETH